MKISWGTRIFIIYCGFVALILTLVIASMHQHFDLVSDNYYDQEVAYQKVIDAGRNTGLLSTPITVHADARDVVIDLPAQFADHNTSGSIQFYSPVNASWDQHFAIAAVNHLVRIPRSRLRNTRYILKIDLSANNNKYYQQTELDLHS